MHGKDEEREARNSDWITDVSRLDQIMNINWPRMSQEERDMRMKDAREHVRFVCTLYRLQHDEGRDIAREPHQGVHRRRYLGDRPVQVRRDFDDAGWRGLTSFQADKDHDQL